MSGLSIHEKRQLAEQLAREQLSKSGQYRFGIPQSVLNVKANEFMRLSDKEIQQKFNEYFQSTGLNAKPKDLWDSMGLNLEQKKKAEAHMKGLQKQINKKYMRPASSNKKKTGAKQATNILPNDVKKETRQFMVALLKQAFNQKSEEFRNYLLNNKSGFAEGAMELHDLGSKFADKLTEIGIVVERGDTRAEIREKLIKKQAEIDVLESYVDDEKSFNELFKKYFNENFDYQSTFDYICASSEFTTQDSSKKIEKFNKKFNDLTKTNLKSADDYMGNASGAGGLMDLAFNVALMYVSGGSSAIAKYAQMTAKGGTEIAENAITKVVGKKLAQSSAGQAMSQGVGIVAAQTTSAGLNAVAFQGTKTAELAGETLATGEFDTEKAKNIVASAEGLFKFGYVGGAISGPLGMQVKGLTTKLLNSKPIINQILTKGITSRPAPLTSVLKDISEHSEAIGEVLKFGTEFGINAGYMAYDEGVSYTDAMANLAQMDGVSKMVIAMLGGKNLEFLTPKKVQQIKTDLAGYKVNIAIYEGQKVYSVKDAKGKETVLATPEELFMFILDKEAQKVGIKAEHSKSDNTPHPNPQVMAEETKPKGKLAVEENNVKSTKELIEKAQTTNPTENVKNKVISEVAKDIKDEGMRLNTPESLDAELAEAEQNPNAPVDNMEAFNLVINGKIGNVLKAQYDNASNVFKDIAKKYSSELDKLEKQYGNDKKLFAEKFTAFLADKLGVKGIEPEIEFRDTGDADGFFDWPTGKLVVNSKLNNSKDIQSMIAHEFVHVMQFKDMIANKGAKKAISSILMHTNNGKYITAEAVNLAKFNGEDWNSISAAEQQMYKEVRAEMLADEVMEANKGLVDFAQKHPTSKGSLNEYLSRIYQNEYENMKTDVNSPEYYEQVIENEAYYLGSGQLGLNLKGHINFVDIQAKAPTKLNNVGISKGNLVVSYKSPYANPNTASQKSKKLMYKIIAGEVKIAELDDNYILDIWSRKHYSHIEDTPYIKEYMERFDAICEKNTITMYPGENALRTISVDCGTTDGVFSIGKPGRPAAAARCKISDLDKVNSKDLLKLVQTRVNKDKNIYISLELKDVECSDKIENSTIFVIVPDEGKELKGFDWSKTGTCQESGFGSDVFQANVDKNGLSTEVVFPSTARFTQIGKAEILPYTQKNEHGKIYTYDIKIVFVKPIY